MQTHSTGASPRPLHGPQWHLDYRAPEPGQQHQSRIQVQVASFQTQDHDGANQCLQHEVRVAQPVDSI